MNLFFTVLKFKQGLFEGEHAGIKMVEMVIICAKCRLKKGLLSENKLYHILYSYKVRLYSTLFYLN